MHIIIIIIIIKIIIITLNPLLSPPSQISPLPLIGPPFQGKKVNKPPISFKPSSPPLSYLFFTSKWWTVLINHNCKTSCGLTWDGLITNWKVGFDSDPRLRDLQLHVLEFFHFVF